MTVYSLCSEFILGQRGLKRVVKIWVVLRGYWVGMGTDMLSMVCTVALDQLAQSPVAPVYPNLNSCGVQSRLGKNLDWRADGNVIG